MKDLKIMPSALRSLANEIQSPDDIPAMCLRDAADLIEFLERQLAERTDEIEKIQRFATVNRVAEIQSELAKVREQRDRLAAVSSDALKCMCRVTSPDHEFTSTIDALDSALAAVKGGKDG